MQHDIYSWQIEGPKIKAIKSVDNNSEIVNGIVRSWLKNTTPKQRENFINVVFEIIQKTNVTNIHELSAALLKNMGTVLNTYRNIDEEERKEITNILKMLIKTSFSTLKEEIPVLLEK